MEKLTDEDNPNDPKEDQVTQGIFEFTTIAQNETIIEPSKKGQENEDPNDTTKEDQVTAKGHDQDETITDESPKKGQEKPFKCSKCTKSYCEKQDLEDHVTHYHLTICEICRQQVRIMP